LYLEVLGNLAME